MKYKSSYDLLCDNYYEERHIVFVTSCHSEAANSFAGVTNVTVDIMCWGKVSQMV